MMKTHMGVVLLVGVSVLGLRAVYSDEDDAVERASDPFVDQVLVEPSEEDDDLEDRRRFEDRVDEERQMDRRGFNRRYDVDLEVDFEFDGGGDDFEDDVRVFPEAPSGRRIRSNDPFSGGFGRSMNPGRDMDMGGMGMGMDDMGMGRMGGMGMEYRDHDGEMSEEDRENMEAEHAVGKAEEQIYRTRGEARGVAMKKLKVALDRLFDVRTRHREHQIEDLERRIKGLRNKLKQRVDQKDKIVDLRLQTIVGEADGLTF